MMESRGSLAGQVVEDLSFRPLAASEFEAQLKGQPGKAYKKAGGYFCFPSLQPGGYQLQITGRGLQTFQHEVRVTDGPCLLQTHGQNEFWARVEDSRTTAEGTEISFKPMNLPRPIEAGAPVIGPNFRGRLVHRLGPGVEAAAFIDTEEPIRAGRLIRLVRNWSCRARLGPFRQLAPRMLSLAGLVRLGGAPLAGASVRIKTIDDKRLFWHRVGEARLATLGRVGTLLGAAGDLEMKTDRRGLYHLYLSAAKVRNNLCLEIRSHGRARLLTLPAGQGRRFHETDL